MHDARTVRGESVRGGLFNLLSRKVTEHVKATAKLDWKNSFFHP